MEPAEILILHQTVEVRGPNVGLLLRKVVAACRIAAFPKSYKQRGKPSRRTSAVLTPG